jgi:gluconolactonase
VAPDGTATYLTAGDFLAPNDLVVVADDTVWFTDPPHYPPSGAPTGRVHTMRPDVRTTVVASGFLYCNGIALEPDGTLVVVEAYGLQRLNPDGTREWIVEQLGGGAGDGVCVDQDGRIYVANTAAHGVRVLEPDGTEVDFLALDGKGVTTNCCFGGTDLRTLFATDGVPGNIVAWEGLPSPGVPVQAWSGP